MIHIIICEHLYPPCLENRAGARYSLMVNVWSSALGVSRGTAQKVYARGTVVGEIPPGIPSNLMVLATSAEADG